MRPVSLGLCLSAVAAFHLPRAVLPRTRGGDATMMTDPIASPAHALPAALGRLPPLQIHVGLSEVNDS